MIPILHWPGWVKQWTHITHNRFVTIQHVCVWYQSMLPILTLMMPGERERQTDRQRERRKEGERGERDRAATHPDNARAVWSDQPSLVLSHQLVLHAYHILLGDAFCNYHHQLDLGFDCLYDSVSSKRGRYVDYSRLCSCLIFCLKQQNVQVCVNCEQSLSG